MASRIIHYAIANKIAEKYQIKNFDRFALGVMLPDAYAQNKGTNDSHLKISVCGGSKKTYDLEKFQTMFAQELKEDDLYRGYYLHLIQDLFFRDFVYNEHRWNPTIPGNVERLHRDYGMVNAYVIEHYQLKNRLIIPSDIYTEPLCQLYPFDTEQLARDFWEDFAESEPGEIFFFTAEMADVFIERACEYSLRELKALDCGDSYTDMYLMAWKNKAHSLLETTLNTRDLGGYRTAYETYTKWGSILRSDVMKYANEADIALLREMHIHTVIDVRGEKDVCKSPNSLQCVPGFCYRNCPIDEGSGVPDSPDHVSNSYMRIAAAENIAEVFRTIANAPRGVLFHCTAGKDRSGVIGAILLMLAGVDEDDIVWDYMITRECNAPRFDMIHEKFPEIDMTIVIPQERYMREFIKMFYQKYGTAERYLCGLGLSDGEVDRLKKKLVSCEKPYLECM